MKWDLEKRFNENLKNPGSNAEFRKKLFYRITDSLLVPRLLFYSLKVKQFVQSIIEHVLFNRISIPFQIQSKENEKAGENWNGSSKIFLKGYMQK